MAQGISDQAAISDLAKTMIELAKETIVVIDCDIEATGGPLIRFINAAAERLTGFSRSNLVGQRLDRIVLADMLPAVISQLRWIRDTGETLDIELCAKTAQGTDYWIDLSTVPMFDAQGQLQHFMRIGRDITSRKRAEGLRDTTQRLLAAIFGVIDSPLLVTDEAGSIVMANAALTSQFGWSALDVINRPMTSLLTTADQLQFSALLSAVDGTDQPRKVEARLMHRDGSSTLCDVKIVTVRQPDGQRYFIFKFIQGAKIPVADNAVTLEAALRAAVVGNPGPTAVVAGKLQLVGLEAVRERLGDRWPQLMGRTLDMAERVIEKHLQAGDIVRRSTDGGFLIFFAKLSETEAQFKAQAIGGEIREKLIGEVPEAMDAKVTAYASAIEIEEEEVSGAEDSIIDALGKHLEEERKRLEAEAMTDVKVGLQTGKALFQNAQSNLNHPAPVLMARLPRSLREALGRLESLGRTPFTLEAEIFLLAKTEERTLVGLMKQSLDLIVTPVSLATLSQPHNLEVWLKVARTPGEAGQRQVVAEVTDLPRDIAQVRMRDIMMRLSTLFRTVAFELPTSDPRFVSGLPDATRLATISFRRLIERGADPMQAAARLMRPMAIRNCRLIVKDTPSARVAALAKAGVPLMLSA